jgi:hypothetical protein
MTVPLRQGASVDDGYFGGGAIALIDVGLGSDVVVVVLKLVDVLDVRDVLVVEGAMVPLEMLARLETVPCQIG